MKSRLTKSIFVIIVFGSFVIYTFCRESSSLKREKVQLIESGVKSECEIQRNGKYLDCLYKFDGQNYRKRINNLVPKIKDGEKYQIYFVKENPSKAYVDLSSPILDQDEFLMTQPISLNLKWYGKKKLIFEYKVGDKIYNRYQWLGSRKVNLDSVKVIKYKRIDPEIAYIIF